MQHPDEGTIHSWLDNALSAEEAARVASHVAECPQCAAAVAEARGFIAASSRILTALDDVPRGVVPAVPTRKREFRVLWRAAAAVLVVAGGSLIVMRDGGDEMRSAATLDSTSIVAESNPPAAAAVEAASADGDVPAVAPAPKASGAPASVSKRRAVAQGAPVDLAAPAIARISEETQLSAASVGTVQSAPRLFKELSVEKTPGTRRILYQVSAADTVTLTEIESLSLQSVVMTGVATAQDVQQKTARTRAVAPTRSEPTAVTAAAPPPPAPLTDSRRADTLAAAEGAVTMQAGAAGATRRDAAANVPRVNSIRWVEAGTGKTLVLSGKLSVERLQEIKRRIETERAASGKKTP